MCSNTEINFPPEWAAHECVWTAWPSAPDLWAHNLDGARAEIAAMIEAITAPDPDDPNIKGERVELLVRGTEAAITAQEALEPLCTSGLVRLHEAPIGDIWLRDTGPIFHHRGDALTTVCFTFNGWGGKYLLGDDPDIAGFVSQRANSAAFSSSVIVEGGAIDTNGQGTALTTRQCLLHKNRNPNLSQADLEQELRAQLGIEKVIWLDEGLLNDHTDGHVDNIARFIGPERVVCMRPSGADDPNAALYADILYQLSHATTAEGTSLEIVEIPSPGLITDEDGTPIPASHVNFYIANHSLIMPVYALSDEQHEQAELALTILGSYIEREYIYGLSAHHLLTGGGAFHCITQQQPIKPASNTLAMD